MPLIGSFVAHFPVKFPDLQFILDNTPLVLPDFLHYPVFILTIMTMMPVMVRMLVGNAIPIAIPEAVRLHNRRKSQEKKN